MTLYSEKGVGAVGYTFMYKAALLLAWVGFFIAEEIFLPSMVFGIERPANDNMVGNTSGVVIGVWVSLPALLPIPG